MIDKIKAVADCIVLMDKQLKNELFVKNGVLQDKKLWNNTHIKKQLERRKNGESFSSSDHIRAMVYSMLSSGISWERVESGIDIKTGKILPIDEIFYQYDAEKLLSADPDELTEKIKNLHCASQYTKNQMNSLIGSNIGKLLSFEKEYGSIDAYYQIFIEKDSTLKSLVYALSDSKSKDKLSQMGEALTAEYLKNVGYDIAKPDRHICRILGSKILGCSKHEIVPPYEAIDIIADLAKHLRKATAEVDYILWAYCAKGYGEICTKSQPKCSICKAEEYCNNIID